MSNGDYCLLCLRDELSCTRDDLGNLVKSVKTANKEEMEDACGVSQGEALSGMVALVSAMLREA